MRRPWPFVTSPLRLLTVIGARQPVALMIEARSLICSGGCWLGFFGLGRRSFSGTMASCAQNTGTLPAYALGVAVVLYFSLSRVLDRETVSWVCIVGAAPVAAAGFFQYNGLTLERFLWAWLKSEVIMAGKRVWKSENYYEEALKREVKKH